MILTKMRILVLFLVLLTSRAWAQEEQEANPTGLKNMAVGQIFEYAQTLYDRGNYREAAHTFQHILKLDPQFEPAKEYLRKMNQPLPNPTAASNSDFSGPNADLKRQIAAEDEAIDELNQND